MNSLTKIRKAVFEDLGAILDLVRSLARYEQAENAVTATLQDYEKNFLEGVFEALVAEDKDQRIIGTTIYYLTWSTWKGRMLYLEDFVVADSDRGQGVGKLLFDSLLQEAISMDCRLLKWQVLDWNIPAINFYNKYDAIIEKQWWNGKLILDQPN